MTIPATDRRATDRKKHDIEAMIAAENDPKQRAFLIVLNSINQSLEANTVVTSHLSSKFDSHLTAFEEKVKADAELLNQGKGAWKVIAWVLGGAQALLIGLAGFAATDLSAIHKDLNEGKRLDAQLDARVKSLEQKK